MTLTTFHQQPARGRAAPATPAAAFAPSLPAFCAPRALAPARIRAVAGLCMAAWAGLACADPGAGAAATLPAVEVREPAGPDGDAGASAVGSKEALPARQVPHSVSVLTEQRIREQNLTTAAEALGQVTGVTVIANDTTQSQMRSRGYSLGVSYDGIPAYNALSGTQQFVLAMYERVEVLRGPAGILSGSGEPGGLVNFVRKKPRGAPGLGMALSTGSWRHHKASIDATGPLNRQGSARGRAVLFAQDRDYFYDRTHTRKWLGYGVLDVDLARSTMLTLSAAVQDDDTPAASSGLPAWSTGGLVHARRSMNAIADWSRYRWTTQEYTAELEHRFAGGWLLRARLSHRPQDFYFKDGYASTGVDPATGTLGYARRVRDYDDVRNAVDLYASGQFSLLGRRHALLLGYNRETFSSRYAGANALPVTGIVFGDTSTVPDFDLPYDLGRESRTVQSGFYGQTRLSVADPLTVVAGGRISRFGVRSRSVAPAAPGAWSDGARASGEFTPYAAALFDFADQWTAYASLSDIFIPQAQLRADGRALDPRTGRQAEVGLKVETPGRRLQASLAYFRLRDRHRAWADPAHTGFYLNAGEVQSRGWELEATGRPAPGYSIEAGYTRMDSVYARDANNQGLPFTTWEPRHTLKLWGVRRFGSGVLSGLTLGLGAHAVSGSAAGSGTGALRRQGGYAVFGAMASYRLSPGVTLGIHLNNLTDRTYYTRLGGTNTYNTYGEPRNVSLSLRADI